MSPCCVASFVDYNYGVWYCCRACGRWYEQAFNVERSAPMSEVPPMMAFAVYPARQHAGSRGQLRVYDPEQVPLL